MIGSWKTLDDGSSWVRERDDDPRDLAALVAYGGHGRWFFTTWTPESRSYSAHGDADTLELAQARADVALGLGVAS